MLYYFDSINAKHDWREIVGFVFTGHGFGSNDIVKLLKILLPKLKDAGADVKALVCDQVSYNAKAFSDLGAKCQNPDFLFDGVQYCAMFDWPHLIKRLIYQLRTHKMLYDSDGVTVIANFDDIKGAWELDRLGQSQVLAHIDASHFEPNAFQAMNVKRAFQLLSNRMASSITLAGEAGKSGLGLKSQTWKQTAYFVKTMNAIIDACNAYYFVSLNPLKRPLSDRNPEIEARLIFFLNWSKNWKIKNKKGEWSRPPCFNGLRQTVQALLNIYRRTKQTFPKFELCTGLCNQDSVEHRNCQFRGRGGFCFNPTCRTYRITLRHLLSANQLKTSKKGNVVCPDAPSLINNKDGHSSEQSMTFEPVATSTFEADEETENSHLTETSNTEIEKEAVNLNPFIPSFNDDENEVENFEILNAVEEFNSYLEEDDAYNSLRLNLSDLNTGTTGMYETNAVVYFAGYIGAQIVRKNNCDNCRAKFLKVPIEDSNFETEKYIHLREYDHKDEESFDVTWLSRPTDYFANVIFTQLQAFSQHHKQYWSSKKLLGNLLEVGKSATNSKFQDYFDRDHECYEHRIDALKFLYRVKIYAKTAQNNKAKRESAMKKNAPLSKNRKLSVVQNL